jgi:hypothetical protein
LFRADLASSPFLRRVVSSRPQVTAAFEGDVQVLQQLRG